MLNRKPVNYIEYAIFISLMFIEYYSMLPGIPCPSRLNQIDGLACLQLFNSVTIIRKVSTGNQYLDLLHELAKCVGK